jgi:hypothetical protein
MHGRYHWNKLDQFVQRMQALKHEIDEIDEYLASADQQNLASNPKGALCARVCRHGSQLLCLCVHTALLDIFNGQWESLKAITGRVSAVHAAADQLREQYIAIRGVRALAPFALACLRAPFAVMCVAACASMPDGGVVRAGIGQGTVQREEEGGGWYCFFT